MLYKAAHTEKSLEGNQRSTTLKNGNTWTVCSQSWRVRSRENLLKRAVATGWLTQVESSSKSKWSRRRWSQCDAVWGNMPGNATFRHTTYFSIDAQNRSCASWQKWFRNALRSKTTTCPPNSPEPYLSEHFQGVSERQVRSTGAPPPQLRGL